MGAQTDDTVWFLATARQRVAGLLEPGSFHEFIPPEARVSSPHLHLFDLPVAFDDGMIVGRGRLAGRDVLLAAQEGQFMGGTFAEISGAKLTGLLRAATANGGLPRTVLLLLDSGGVRLQEANAGELAVAEVMRAIAQARAAGIEVIAVIGGRAGAFGGAGLTAGTCGRIVVSEQGRIGVTGPEVIETNKGVEEFDSADRALVWRTTGGRNRILLGAADAIAGPTIGAFRAAILGVIGRSPPLDLATLRSEQARLHARRERLGGCADAPSMWRALGIGQADAIADLDDAAFAGIVDEQEEARHDAR